MPTKFRAARTPVRSASFLGGLLAVTLLASSANAVPVVIDDFSVPGVATSYVIGLNNSSPYLLKQAAAIGGERDLLLNVIGSPNAISAVGIVGNNNYVFGTTGSVPSQVTLQYDGVDGGDTTGGLVNALGLNVDATGGGVNNGVRLEFGSIDAGAGSTVSVRVTATSAGGASATFFGAMPENSTPINFDIPFSTFTIVGAFNPLAVTSFQVTFNELGVNDVDFQLNRILTAELPQVPEPGTFALLGCGGVAALAMVRRRRQQA